MPNFKLFGLENILIIYGIDLMISMEDLALYKFYRNNTDFTYERSMLKDNWYRREGIPNTVNFINYYITCLSL